MTTNSAFSYRSVTNSAAIPVPALNVQYALLGLRLPPGLITTAQIASFYVIDVATNPTAFYLVFNPTVAGTFTYSAVPGSKLLTAVGTIANTITANGTILASGYSLGWQLAGFTSSRGPFVNQQIPLDTPGNYVLVGMYAASVVPSVGIGAALNWIESVS